MSLKRVSHTDQSGRKRMVLLPEDVPETEAERGILVGPPLLDDLDLPEEISVRLNNELFHRNIFTLKDAMQHRTDVISALLSTFRLDTERIISVYMGGSYQAAKQEVKLPSQDSVARPFSRNRRRRN